MDTWDPVILGQMVPSPNNNSDSDRTNRLDALRKLVRQSVAALPEIYRNVVELTYFWDQSQRKIAREVGISQEGVRQRLITALDKLADDLGPKLGLKRID